MEDFELLMNKTIDVFSTVVSIWGYSFSFLDIVGWTLVITFSILVIRAILWLDE